MAQFRTTEDLVDSVLRRCGELTNGTSSFESQALDYLNRIHHTIISGGNEFNIEVDEPWTWGKSKNPIILELQPALETGTVSLTQGSESGAFSVAPSYSVAGWFLKIDNREEYFRIASHTAAATAFELDAAYTGETGGTLGFKAIKLDYQVVSDYIIIDEFSDRLEFKKTSGGSILTATLTRGSYTPSALATHAAAVMTTAASGPTITGAYDSVTRKFTFTSDGAGSTTLIPQFASGTNNYRSAHRLLGFDDEDLAAALTQTSAYVLSSVVRMIQPLVVYKADNKSFTPASTGNIYGMDELAFQKKWPLTALEEGIPSRFTKVEERSDGTIVVRFNRFPAEKTRIEVNHIPVPRDLKNNSSSIPLIPRKFVDLLEYGATFYVLVDKNDDKAPSYAQLAGQKLTAMMKQNRKELMRLGEFFGRAIPRLDNVQMPRRLIFGEPQD